MANSLTAPPALHVSSNITKRKATDSIDIFCDSEDAQDSENIDPTAFFKNKTNSQTYKRSKTSLFTKSVHFETIVKPTPSISPSHKPATSSLLPTAPTQRKIAKPRSRLKPRDNATKTTKSSTNSDKMLNARLNRPAGRSPQTARPRVSSLLSDRARPAPAFGIHRLRTNSVGLVKSASLNSALSAGGEMPFSLATALQGTVPTAQSSLPDGGFLKRTSSTGSRPIDYVGRAIQANLPKANSAPMLSTPLLKEHRAAWDFEIHEDTADQERSNIVSHYADQLDLSGDESSDNGDFLTDDKENMPPSDENSLAAPEYHNTPRVASPEGQLLALSPTGEPAAAFERPSPGGLPRSPGVLDLKRFLTTPTPDRGQGGKKRRVLGELPVEEYTPDEVKEEMEKEKGAEEEKEEGGEGGEGWLRRGSVLSPIEEDGGDDVEMEAGGSVQVQVFPPRTSSLPNADTN